MGEITMNLAVFIREKVFLYVENKTFELIKKSLNQPLSKKEQEQLLQLMQKRIHYLEEEFTSKQNDDNSFIMARFLTNGLTLIADVFKGLETSKQQPITKNLQQLAAHYQTISDYEQQVLIYKEEPSYEHYYLAEEKYQEAQTLKEGYELPKILSKIKNQ